MLWASQRLSPSNRARFQTAQTPATIPKQKWKATNQHCGPRNARASESLVLRRLRAKLMHGGPGNNFHPKLVSSYLTLPQQMQEADRPTHLLTSRRSLAMFMDKTVHQRRKNLRVATRTAKLSATIRRWHAALALECGEPIIQHRIRSRQRVLNSL